MIILAHKKLVGYVKGVIMVKTFISMNDLKNSLNLFTILFCLIIVCYSAVVFEVYATNSHFDWLGISLALITSMCIKRMV